MRFWFALFLFLAFVYGESFSDFLKNDTQSFKADKKSFAKHSKKLNAEFDRFKKIADEEFKAYKKSLGRYWSDPKISDQKRWVDYAKDKKSRSIVDFKEGSLEIDVYAKNRKEAQKLIAKRLAQTILKDTKQAYKDDELSQKIEKRLKGFNKASIEAQPILAPVIFKKPPSVKKALNYVKKTLKSHPIKSAPSKLKKLKLYSLKVPLPKKGLLKRAKLYIKRVKKEARSFGMPVALVLAVIQTESYFNPMARSHIPAYGLMQIVPRSAGQDVYYYLYGKRRLLSPSYLYNANNNIKLGTAYLSMNYNKYLKAIKNPKSRLYCTIAAYNTGAGNVARAFDGSTNPKSAAKKINRMSSKQVYNHLLKYLKYVETRHYLRNVTTRMQSFARVYK